MAEFKEIPVSELILDRENPRLPTRLKGAGEEEILKYLGSQTNIAELVTSIGENDFFPGEAIVVTRDQVSIGKYLVLEGNRRLTALRLLHDDKLAKEVSAAVAEAVTAVKHRPCQVPAYEVDSREDVLQYLGFRHVSGVQRWDPLAKARYLKMLYLHCDGKAESRYIQIANEIGSRRDTVCKNLDALAAYELVEKENFFGVASLNEERFQFGVFYTALANSEIARFAGARNSQGPTHPIEDPETLKKSEIGELVHWIFARDSKGATRLGESRNIRKLAAVVSTPIALERFRNGATLDDALRDTPDIQEEFIKEIDVAISHIRLAKSKLSSVSAKKPEARKALSDLKNEVDEMWETLSD